MTAGPPEISDYGLLSDCHSAALVSSHGSVDWWGPPRFDSPAVFGRLLDPDAGHWSIAPVDAHTVTRDYVGDSLVLRTVLRTATGAVAVTDALALHPGSRGHEIGFDAPHTLLRTVAGLDGTVTVAVEVAPRLEYGLTEPRWYRDGRTWMARAGPVGLRLTDDSELTATGGTLAGRYPVAAGQRVRFRLAYEPTYEPVDRGGPEPSVHDTLEAWYSWAALHRGYQGRYLPQVRRSALVLQGLTFQRSGAVVAAATTSLPEQIGADLNWDYRFAWLRDVSLTMQALWVAACPDEAGRFFDWIADAFGPLGGAPLQIMFGVTGERDLTEHELDHLAGHRASRPVRVGNDAWKQRQLDVLGEVLFAAELLRERIGELSDATRELLVSLADQAADSWRLPDSGMWESREHPRHYTSSKVMCWVALDRAVRLAGALGVPGRAAGWATARDEIRAAVLRRAWCERIGAYAGAFDSDRLDASVLLLPLVGFLPADDPRMLATIEAVRDRLADGPLVRRWYGDSAAFVACGFWLVECLALAGRVDEAGVLFDDLLGHGNDLGLFAEEIDPATGRQLGNHPQAFSHVGLINAAWRLTGASAAGGAPRPA
ncbi:glycoside hydrolase family 15 protein [Polymorphospora lycopeni]|uniref:Glycoside hydrolase family 15 protein n=1 Tax=Polymorphospora lycopeni TaxID=3140240 RepID=A0ABV5D0H7_9ACTN